MFIFLAQEKGTKRTSTLTHPLPIWRGSNSELQKPTVLRAFWYRGTTRWEMRETSSVPLFRRPPLIPLFRGKDKPWPIGRGFFRLILAGLSEDWWCVRNISLYLIGQQGSCQQWA
jgi:hypothetical protein